jgi:hypothetical protein
MGIFIGAFLESPSKKRTKKFQKIIFLNGIIGFQNLS